MQHSRAPNSNKNHTTLSMPATRVNTRLRGVSVRPRMLAQPARAFPEDLINNISVAIKNSPLNEGKKALAIAQAGQYDEAAVRAKVEGLISASKVAVFSWSGCPFCKKAKALLQEVGAEFTAIELDTMGAEGKAMRAELAKMTGRTSVPNIFIGGAGVGGCSDGPGVVALHAQGQLVPLLAGAGALPS